MENIKASLEGKGNLQLRVNIYTDADNSEVTRMSLQAIKRDNVGNNIINEYANPKEAIRDLRQFAEFLHDMADKIDIMTKVLP